jgi:hypothetical protein
VWKIPRRTIAIVAQPQRDTRILLSESYKKLHSGFNQSREWFFSSHSDFSCPREMLLFTLLRAENLWKGNQKCTYCSWWGPAALFKRIKTHGQLRPSAISCWNSGSIVSKPPQAAYLRERVPGTAFVYTWPAQEIVFFSIPLACREKNCFARLLMKMRVAKSAFGDNTAPDFLVVAFFFAISEWHFIHRRGLPRREETWHPEYNEAVNSVNTKMSRMWAAACVVCVDFSARSQNAPLWVIGTRKFLPRAFKIVVFGGHKICYFMNYSSLERIE